MCYNSEMSFAFSTIGYAMALYIYMNNISLRNAGIHYIIGFYATMELLQGIQYFFVNECSDFWNKFFTEIAYIFVIIQPLFWNIFYYTNSDKNDKPIFMTSIILFLVWMFVHGLSRLLYSKDKYPQTKDHSIFSSDTVCTKRKKTHLYWEWTSANFRDYNATFLMYFMLWFIPPFISRTFRYNAVSYSVLASFLTGLYMAIYVAKEPFIFASVWCYISIPIIALFFIRYILLG